MKFTNPWLDQVQHECVFNLIVQSLGCSGKSKNELAIGQTRVQVKKYGVSGMEKLCLLQETALNQFSAQIYEASMNEWLTAVGFYHQRRVDKDTGREIGIATPTVEAEFLTSFSSKTSRTLNNEPAISASLNRLCLKLGIDATPSQLNSSVAAV